MSASPFPDWPRLFRSLSIKRWDTLREAQVEACRVLFDTPHHLLIASGTASGKTEVAFFPALTELYNVPSSSVGILYIGPLKALINDQFERISDLLKEGQVPVWHWHGDVSRRENEADAEAVGRAADYAGIA